MSPLAGVPLNNDTVTPGVLCLGIVVLMGLVLYFLLRNMSKQINRIEAPKEADLKQAEWEARQAARTAAKAGDDSSGGTEG